MFITFKALFSPSCVLLSWTTWVSIRITTIQAYCIKRYDICYYGIAEEQSGQGDTKVKKQGDLILVAIPMLCLLYMIL